MMEMILAVVVFAFLIETVVEVLKPLLRKLEGVGSVLGVEIAYVLSLA